eukprot:3686730-Pyramimonas_sp.AAC.1
MRLAPKAPNLFSRTPGPRGVSYCTDLEGSNLRPRSRDPVIRPLLTAPTGLEPMCITGAADVHTRGIHRAQPMCTRKSAADVHTQKQPMCTRVTSVNK